MKDYRPLLQAIKVKGDNVFSSKSELVGILAFNLGILTVGEAKELIEEAIKEGIIEETPEGLIVHEDAITEKESKRDIFGEMVEYLARELELSEIEVLEEIEKMKERYGNLDKKILAYLFGLSKGVNMEKFKEYLEDE
ncbi:hypothetical protein PFDSM3638_05885 [Pyrococcus furiosus DSM 3638]|uniref:DUF2240 domain-containing protein n=3 Tax=Pyrococcus furiosus TaxID=2261 RepID=A0A5C0XPA5_PYRFU|nr:UPF0175 family protein [Pyrococcus furiosus]AAL81298.1 hypothetical protein PF1174 [Pyrococcus furiosus DSM 3638]AFN03965.1 hypothetical protein PFC_05090 [Pyrococcus furiosus COM1]QEK78827.1 hypothetical protein PFDSM3638_05885 [Pyrococcus furiosus DSM 3638]